MGRLGSRPLLVDGRSDIVPADRADVVCPRDMWSTVNRLLGRGSRACDGVSAEELSTFFADKVKRVQAATSGSPPPAFRPAPPGISFAEFEPCHPMTLQPP